jgi:hypothetical protein
MKWTGLLIVLFFTACESQQSKSPAKPHAYFFYPSTNVYLDTVNKHFSYFDSSQQKWVSGNSLPATILSDLGKSVLIDSAPQPIWAANAEHRMIYAAKLYADSADFREPPEPTSEEKAAAAQKKKDEDEARDQAADQRERDRKKTKVGKLLDRIFHKKDKDKKN